MFSLYPFRGVQGLDSGHSIGHVSTHFDGLEPGLWIVDCAHPMCAPRGSKNVEMLMQSCSLIAIYDLHWFSWIKMR